MAELPPGALRVVLVTPGDDGASSAVERAGPLGTLDVAAVRSGRVAVLSHPDGWRPCTGIIGVAQEMDDILRSLGAKEEGAP